MLGASSRLRRNRGGRAVPSDLHLDGGKRARFFFQVMNLPLDRPLTLDRLHLTPLEDPDNLAQALQVTDATHVLTASGHYDVSQRVPSHIEHRNEFARDADAEFTRAADALTILTSFATRRSVQVPKATLYAEMSEGEEPADPTFVVESDGVRWHYMGGNSLRGVFPGRASGHPWYFTQDELEEFLARNYDRLRLPADPPSDESPDGTGLRLAMHHLNAARADDWVEWQFLKAWTGLEALIARSPQSRKRLPLSEDRPNEHFEPVREAVKETISTLPGDVRPSRKSREAMFLKISELNREALLPSAMRFFKETFRSYEHQAVSQDELRKFISIRNSITHTGIMDLDALRFPVGFPFDYGSVLPSKQSELESLVEKIVLALLGEHPHTMNVPWQDWRHA